MNKTVKRPQIKLTRAQLMKIIALYRAAPELWNSQHKYYSRRDITNKAWLGIAEKMGMGVQDVKKKLKSLRSTYNAAKKKAIRSSTTSAGEDNSSSYEPSWYWYNSMSFIDDFIILRKPYHNENDRENLFDNDVSFDFVEVQNEKDEANLSSCDLSLDEEDQHSVEHKQNYINNIEHNSKNRDKIANKYSDMSESSTVDQIEGISDEFIDSKNNETSEYNIFCNSIAAQLNKLPEQIAYPLMGEIQNLVVQHKLAYLNSKKTSNYVQEKRQTWDNMFMCNKAT